MYIIHGQTFVLLLLLSTSNVTARAYRPDGGQRDYYMHKANIILLLLLLLLLFLQLLLLLFSRT